MYKVGDFVGMYLGLDTEEPELVEIIDEEIIEEIGAHDYYIRTSKGIVIGPFHSRSFIPIVNPNDVMKSSL